MTGTHTAGMAITDKDRLALKEGDVVSRKFRGEVTNYVVVNLTASRRYFWVRETQWGDDGSYDEHHDLTGPKWSVVSTASVL